MQQTVGLHKLAIFFIFGLCPALSVSSVAQNKGTATAGLGSGERLLEGEREFRARIDSFFKYLQSEKTSEAFASLTKGSPMSKKPESVNALVKQTSEVMKAYGQARSNELIRVNRLGAKLIRFTYFSYSDDAPLRWEFISFNGKAGWQLLDISVNSDFESLFNAQPSRLPSGR